ncbi:hypothetical protein FA15DRAFT_699549 [Coprinopsis marcescibilis]|uniref:Carbohydrate esterase family 16 protein n=1 Tax=Coprinopsis marcescibilis TaxID=230819 RepID=A0A5C3LC13_COPMA|nr:hypothetical protein FA15DRAFT_699549 [Coprinopsis marcescibilis]
MSTVIGVSPSWPGFSGIRKLFVFGASYCSTSHSRAAFSEKYHPTADNPLGVPFPGDTWNEQGLPNWVGHLISKHSPQPRYNPHAQDGQDEAHKERPFLVYNYALGGDTVRGVSRQVLKEFIPTVGTKPMWAPWNERDSLFFTFVGINDTGMSDDHGTNINKLIGLQEKLYQAGARNFVFCDLPPVDNAPAYFSTAIGRHIAQGRQLDLSDSTSSGETTFQRWNAILLERLREFSAGHLDCTVLLFSTHQTFTAVLEDLTSYGFSSGDEHLAGGTFWHDHLHPTSKMHDLMAHFLSEFLGEVPVEDSLSL